MDIANEISQLIGQPEGVHLEYKAVLPPAATMAQLICSFANTEGGFIVLGITDANGDVRVNGLIDEFRAAMLNGLGRSKLFSATKVLFPDNLLSRLSNPHNRHSRFLDSRESLARFRRVRVEKVAQNWLRRIFKPNERPIYRRPICFILSALHLEPTMGVEPMTCRLRIGI
jgi:hypothetical protein